MNKVEFYRLQAEAGLSNRQASELFEVRIRQIVRWRVEEPKAPRAVILVLENMIREGSRRNETFLSSNEQ